MWMTSKERGDTGNFTFMWPCIVTNLFIMKPTRCTNFTNLFWYENLHVSGSSSAHHQEFIHCTICTGMCHASLKTAFEQDQGGTAVPSRSCSKAVYIPVWHMPLLNVQWINSCWWAEELPEICRDSRQNKFGKLVHLVGFIIKGYWELKEEALDHTLWRTRFGKRLWICREANYRMDEC
jgi:hypothetical protein